MFVGGSTIPSTCNGTPIHVSATREFEKALLATGFPKYREHRTFQMAVVNQLV
jgi:fructose-1,6-bisphosphatase/inositol monophosphatase family enzyme